MTDLEGSITARLKLDASQWYAELERAKVAAEELRAVDPTIRVNVDGAAKAAAELAALQAAEESTGRAADDMGRRTENAAKGPVPWMGILVGSIAAVSPGIVAAGAATIALTGELAGLGAAGILAFGGIKTAIAAGIPVGRQYQGILDGLSGIVRRFQQTAATGLLPGFAAAARLVQAAVRPLNTDIAILSRQLGGVLTSAVRTGITAIEGFSPLILAAGRAIQQLLTGVSGFTASNGFTDFINYTVARLPDVMNLISSTLGAVGGLFTALAPGGQSTLFLLSSLMDLIKALAPTIGALMPTVIGLSDALGGIALVVATVLNALGPFGPVIVGTAAAFFGLSAAAKSLAPAMAEAAAAEGVAAAATRGLGAAIDFATGPIGLALVAAGLLASALATMGSDASKSASGISELTAALQQDNGVLGVNTRAMVAKNFADQQVLASAKLLGLSAKTVTDASLGNAAAYGKVTAAANKAADANKTIAAAGYTVATGSERQAAAADKVRAAVDAERKAVRDAVSQYNLYAQAAGNSTKSSAQLATAAARVKMPVDQFIAASTAQQKVAAQAQAAANQMRLEGDAAGLLKLQLDKLNGSAISDAEAQAGWASALDSLTLKTKNHRAALEGDSRAAIENRGSIASIVSTGQTAIESYANQAKSVDALKSRYRSMRDDLIDQAVKLGATRSAATKLVDTYFRLPKNLNTKATLQDDATPKVKKAAAAADRFAKTPYRGRITADNRDAISKTAMARAKADDFARQRYLAKVNADNAQSLARINEAETKATGYAKARYEAFLKANDVEALGKVAATRVRADAFAQRRYEAFLRANAANATSTTGIARSKAQAFADAFYQAKIRADPSNAISGAARARAAIAAVQGKTVTIRVNQVMGGTPTRAGRMATGGTVGHAAYGVTAGYGTVTGPGTSSADNAGIFALANGEEVISNMFGQASQFRRELKAINAGTVRTPTDLARYAGGSDTNQTPFQVVITPKIPGMNVEEMVEVKIRRALTARDRNDRLTAIAGAQGIRG